MKRIKEALLVVFASMLKACSTVMDNDDILIVNMNTLEETKITLHNKE